MAILAVLELTASLGIQELQENLAKMAHKDLPALKALVVRKDLGANLVFQEHQEGMEHLVRVAWRGHQDMQVLLDLQGMMVLMVSVEKMKRV